MALIVTPHKNAKYHGKILTALNGPGDMLEMARGIKEWRGNISWRGGDAVEVYGKATYGDTQFVSRTEAILAQVDAGVDVETKAYRIENAIVGFTPEVPSALAGIPESMITMEATQSDFAPITVWVNSTISAGISDSEMVERGAAITAFIMRLQAIRPVMLKVVVGLQVFPKDSNYLVCPITTLPLSIAQVSYTLCTTGFTRNAYSIILKGVGMGVNDCNGQWDQISRAHGPHSRDPKFAFDVLEFLGGDTEHDLYIPPLHLHDPLLENPVAWITESLQRYQVNQ